MYRYQFNFKFNLSEDMYAEDSVELLQNSGIQFDRYKNTIYIFLYLLGADTRGKGSRLWTSRRCCWCPARCCWMT